MIAQYLIPRNTTKELISIVICFVGNFSTFFGVPSSMYRTCMANSEENKSFCEVPKYVLNTRPHCPKLIKFMNELPK